MIIFQKLRRNRKGNAAPVLTLAFVIFNIFTFLLIDAFARDTYNENVGSSANIEELASKANETGSSLITTWNDLSFIRQAGWVINNLPLWVSLFIGTFQSIFLVVVILSWVRGL